MSNPIPDPALAKEIGMAGYIVELTKSASGSEDGSARWYAILEAEQMSFSTLLGLKHPWISGDRNSKDSAIKALFTVWIERARLEYCKFQDDEDLKKALAFAKTLKK